MTLAHQKTHALAEMWLQKYGDGHASDHLTNVIIDNVNYCMRDMLPYVLLAQKYGYEVSHCEPRNDLWWDFKNWLARGITNNDIESLAKKFAARSVHNVPAYTIANQMRRWETL